MNLKNLAMWAVIVFLTIGLYNMFKNPQSNMRGGNQIIFSDFLKSVENGEILKVEIQGNNIKGVYSNGENFKTYSPNDPNLIEKLSNKGVSISAAPLEEKMPSLFGVLLSWFPMLLLIAVWIFFMRQMQGGKGGAMGFGRSKAKMMNELKGKVTFNDVAGVEEAKEEVEEIVEFLKDPKKFSRLGGKIPRGALLVGPPGTGKTLLARAIAGEAGVPFFTISGSDFVEMFVGVGGIFVKDTSGNTDDTAIANIADTSIIFGDTDINSTIRGDTIILDANGDIRIDSATGLIRFQDSTVDSIVFNAQNGVGQITASGNVSSSGEIIAASGSFEIIHGGTF